MSSLRRIGMALIVVALAIGMTRVGMAPFAAEHIAGGQASPDRTRIIQFRFDVRNTNSRLIERAEIGIFIPVRTAAGQRCCDSVKSSYSSDIIQDAFGNQVLRLRLDHIPPNATKTFSIRVALKISDTPGAAPEPQDRRFISAEPLAQVDHPKIRAQARGLRGKDARQTARRIYDWVSSNLDYAGYLRDARGALHALEKRRGDCTEFMHLFVALARVNGISARGMAGYLVEQNGAVHADAFHNWAEFYADGAWRIADAQRRRFDEGYGLYIATRILGVDSEHLPPSANRFWTVGNGVRVRMR